MKMKWISILLLVPSLSHALPVRNGEHFRVAIKDQFIVSGNNKSFTGEIIREIGNGHLLVNTNGQNSALNDFDSAHPNYAYYGNYMESDIKSDMNDILLVDQFHHTMIESRKAWQISMGSEEVIVAVTDNEFELDHDDLQGSWWANTKEIAGNGIDDDGNGYIDDVYGWDFIAQDNDVDVTDQGTHGTHVTGIIAAQANNQIGVVGIAPNVKVMPLRWYGDEGRWTSAVVAETYYYAVNNGAHIITTSYNIDGLSTDQVYLDAVQFITDNGVLLFNSAGNSNEKNPARQKVEDVILVCSVKSKSASKADVKSRFSNYGTGIDICAPGDPILATVQGRYLGNSRYGSLEGTSMAAPAAAAVAALILSENPNFSREEVLNKLYKSVDNIDGKNRKYKGLLGAGRINVFKAVQ